MKKNNNFLKVVIALVIVGVIGGLAIFCLGKYNLASAKVGIKDKSIDKKLDEFAGVFVTYGTEKVNRSQETLNKEKKVYGEIDLEDNSVQFGELEGEEYVEYFVERKNDPYRTAFLGKNICEAHNNFIYGGEEEQKAELSAKIFFNPDVNKDIICYVNPVYKDSEGELYVTSQNSKKVECEIHQYKFDLEKGDEVFHYYTINMDSNEMNINKNAANYVSVNLNINFGNPTVELQTIAMDSNDQVLGKKTYMGEELKNYKLQEVKGAIYYIFNKKNSNGKAERVMGDDKYILIPSDNRTILKSVYIDPLQ